MRCAACARLSISVSERAVTALGRSRYSLLPDAPEEIPLEATLAALGELVADGKIRTPEPVLL